MFFSCKKGLTRHTGCRFRVTGDTVTAYGASPSVCNSQGVFGKRSLSALQENMVKVQLVTEQPLPEGLHPAKNVDARTMHGRLIKNPKTGMEFVPLYSTLDPIYKVYGENVRLSVITFGEAMQLSRPFAGVILEPGPHQHVILNMKP